MRLIILLSLLPITLLSFAQTEVEFKVSKQNCRKIITDWQRSGLKGKVKSLVNEATDIEASGTKNPDEKTTRFYNNQGYITKEIALNPNGSSQFISSWEYDEQNRITSAKLAVRTDSTITSQFPATETTFFYLYDAKGNLIKLLTVRPNGAETAIDYKHDSRGNVIAEMRTENKASGGTLITYKYDGHCNRILAEHYDADTVYMRITYKYNELDSLIEEESHYTSGTINNKYIHTYDSQGNRIKQEQSFNGTMLSSANTYTYNRENNVAAFNNVTTYQYEYDKTGNWTKCTLREGGVVTQITTREIVYW